MRTSEQINELATALAKAQGAIEGAKKDNVNPHFRSKYADLASVWDACRAELSKNGLSVIQPVLTVDGRTVTVTRLMHTSGQWIEDGGIPLLLGKEDMQGLGSALTYSRRYGLMAMVGIAPEDDDGNAASQKPTVDSTVMTVSKPIPAGDVTIKTAKQKRTAADKPYWELVLAGGEEAIVWDARLGTVAEQACQDGTPVFITAGSVWNGKHVVKTLTQANQPEKKKPAAAKELTASEIPFNGGVHAAQ